MYITTHDLSLPLLLSRVLMLWNNSASVKLCEHKKHAAEDCCAKYVQKMIVLGEETEKGTGRRGPRNVLGFTQMTRLVTALVDALRV